MATPLLRPLLGQPSIRGAITRAIAARVQGPDEATRKRGRSHVWAYARDAAGNSAQAWLATLDPEALQAVLDRLPLPARTRHTVTDRTALERQLQATRERGYSLDVQENEDDICCYGRAIVGRDGRPLGCISVSMPRYRFEETDARPITQAMAECVRDIARECDG